MLDKTRPKTPFNKMTLKQRKWLKLYLECGNAKKAAMEVYNCKEDSAHNIGYENLQKLDYTQFLEEGGITEALLKQKLQEGLDAKDKKQIDYSTRHKYLETALKLKRRLVNDYGGTPAQAPITLVFNLTKVTKNPIELDNK